MNGYCTHRNILLTPPAITTAMKHMKHAFTTGTRKEGALRGNMFPSSVSLHTSVWVVSHTHTQPDFKGDAYGVNDEQSTVSSFSCSFKI